MVIASSEIYFLRFFLSGRWVNAEAAVLFAFFEVLLLRSCWEAILPTRFEVFSFLAIVQFLSIKIYIPFSPYGVPRFTMFLQHNHFCIGRCAEHTLHFFKLVDNKQRRCGVFFPVNSSESDFCLYHDRIAHHTLKKPCRFASNHGIYI